MVILSNDLESMLAEAHLEMYYDINDDKIHFRLKASEEFAANNAQMPGDIISSWYEVRTSWKGRTSPEPEMAGAFKDVGDALLAIVLLMEHENRELTLVRVTRITSFIGEKVIEECGSSIDYKETVLLEYP
jgi:hypothetical protein